jgi:hypothetical protein
LSVSRKRHDACGPDSKDHSRVVRIVYGIGALAQVQLGEGVDMGIGALRLSWWPPQHCPQRLAPSSFLVAGCMSLASRGAVISPHGGAARGEDGQSPPTLRARAAGISQGCFWRWRAGEGGAKMALKMPLWVRDPHVSNRPLPDVQVVVIQEATRRWQTLHRAGRRRRSAWMFPLRSCRERTTASVVRWLLHRAASCQRKNAKRYGQCAPASSQA